MYNDHQDALIKECVIEFFAYPASNKDQSMILMIEIFVNNCRSFIHSPKEYPDNTKQFFFKGKKKELIVY